MKFTALNLFILTSCGVQEPSNTVATAPATVVFTSTLTSTATATVTAIAAPAAPLAPAAVSPPVEQPEAAVTATDTATVIAIAMTDTLTATATETDTATSTDTATATETTTSTDTTTATATAVTYTYMPYTVGSHAASYYQAVENIPAGYHLPVTGAELDPMIDANATWMCGNAVTVWLGLDYNDIGEIEVSEYRGRGTPMLDMVTFPVVNACIVYIKNN